MGLDHDVSEGRTIDHATFFDDPKHSLLLTALRDPVDRIKSSYRFEGRWEQKAEERRIESAKPFAQWVEEVVARPNSRRLWVCVSNYYIKTLIGFPSMGSEGIGLEELEAAKRVLRRFDVVLITETLSDERTAGFLRQTFGHDVPISHTRHPTRAPSPEEADADLFDPITLRAVVEANDWDTELYQYACRLADERMASSETG